MRDKLQKEIDQLECISKTAAALVDYALSLDANATIVLKRDRYVFSPKKFVTFSVHHKRANNLTITMRGKQRLAWRAHSN